MKIIVLVIDSLDGGGAEIANIKLAEAFSEQGYLVHLIMLKNILKFDLDKKINLITLNYEKKYLSLFRDMIYANKLVNILKNIEKEYGKINLILGSLGLTHNLLNRMGNCGNIYYIMHGSTTVSKLNSKKGISKLYKTYKLKKLYNKKNIICVSKGVEKDILSLNIKPLSVQTIYNFFDFDKIKKLSKVNLKEELPKDYIIHVGRFSKVKRHDILLEAFNLLKDKELKLVLLGEGEEKENILKHIKKLNLTNRVVLYGFQKNPYPFIKNAKVLVLSSDNEGFGNVLVESLILNTIVVSTDCPYGPKEILGRQFSQCLCKVANYKSLSLCIENNLKNPKDIKTTDLLPYSKDTVIEQYKTVFS